MHGILDRHTTCVCVCVRCYHLFHQQPEVLGPNITKAEYSVKIENHKLICLLLYVSVTWHTSYTKAYLFIDLAVFLPV